MSTLPVILRSAFLSFVLGALGATVLFIPDNYAEALGFKHIRNNAIIFNDIPARTIIGLLTVVCTISCLTLVVIASWASIRAKVNAKSVRARILKAIDSLSEDERTLLRYCYVQKQQSLSLEATHDAALSLASKGILVQGPVISIIAVPFTIRDFIWDRIRENPELIFANANQISHGERAELDRFHRHVTRHRF